MGDKLRSRQTVMLVVLVAVAILAYGTGAIASRLGTSGRPDWVSPEGVVDESKAPCVTVVKENGKLVMGKNGQPVCLPFGSWHQNPDGTDRVDNPTSRRVVRKPDGSVEEVVQTDGGRSWREIVPRELLAPEELAELDDQP